MSDPCSLPGPRELADLQIAAHEAATDEQKPLVEALSSFLAIIAPYVRAGVSASCMVTAFTDGLDALRAIVECENVA